MAISAEARARWRAWKDAGEHGPDVPLVGKVAADDVIELNERYLLVLNRYQKDGRWRQFLILRRDVEKWGRRSVGIGSWSAEQGVRGRTMDVILANDPDLKQQIEAWFLSRAKPGKRK